MKHLHFDVETAGFYGAYWACAGGSDCAVIAMIGDDPEDRLARSAVKWLCGRGVNVLTMSPAKKDYGHHNYPLERMEAAISWLKANGNKKIGIAGASTTGTLALTAAAMFPEITLTIAMTPSDFVWQGFMQGKKDGCKEWPVEGESLFSYAGKPLPYMEQSTIRQRTAFAVQNDISPFHAKTHQAAKAEGAACDQRIIGGISSKKPYIKNKRPTANGYHNLTNPFYHSARRKNRRNI